jgi:hypothetical protein
LEVLAPVFRRSECMGWGWLGDMACSATLPQLLVGVNRHDGAAKYSVPLPWSFLRVTAQFFRHGYVDAIDPGHRDGRRFPLASAPYLIRDWHGAT